MSEFNQERFHELAQILDDIVDLVGWHVEQNIEYAKVLARVCKNQGIDMDVYRKGTLDNLREARQSVHADILLMRRAYMGIGEGITPSPLPRGKLVFRREDDRTLLKVAKRRDKRRKVILRKQIKLVKAMKAGKRRLGR